jgi:CubicO group peptidase (beta-lactamase class C family)
MNNLHKLSERIDSVLKDWTIPGAAVTIVKDGQPILQRGFGVKEVGTNQKVDAQTAFAIGSNTKSFTAVALGILVDEGKLAWDDLVIKYMPDFALYDDWITQHVTVRDMLSHRVGLQRALYLYQKLDMPKPEIVRRMRYIQPADEFRSEFCYGNSHYTLAGQLVEVISGQTWADFVRERIFTPLGMTDSATCYDDVQEATKNITQPHAVLSDGLFPPNQIGEHQVIPWQNIGNEPAGSIITTATDMIGWLNMIINRGAPILQPETFAALQHPQIIPRNYATSNFAPFFMVNGPTQFYSYGLGFYLFDYRGHKVILGGGQIQGMNASFMVLPELNIGTTVMVNNNYTFGYFTLILMIVDEMLGVNDRDWNQVFLGLEQGLRGSTEAQVQSFIDARRADSPASLPLQSYAGTYHSDLMGEITIAVQDDHLALDYGPGFAGNLTHWENDTFVFTMTAPTISNKDFMRFAIEKDKIISLHFRDGTTLKRAL